MNTPHIEHRRCTALAKYFITFLFAIGFICNAAVFAQGGQLDPSFNPMDFGGTKSEGANKDVRAIAIQPDGKIIIGGNFTSYNGKPVNRIARLLVNGLLDESFNISGTGTDSTVYSIALQADGKILIGGAFTSFNGAPANYLTRLNADGTKDAGFNTGTGTDGPVNIVLLQPDQQILVGGDFLHYNTSETNYLVRINADGTIDPLFAASGITGAVNDVALETDGHLFAGFENAPYLNRLNNDGSADDLFNSSGTGADGPVKALAVQADGKILIGGFFSLYNNLVTNLTRITTDGTIDPSFDNTAGGLPYPVQKIILQPDGKIIAAMGEYKEIYSNGNVEGSKIVRLHNDGLPDATFVHEFYSELNENVYAMALQPDGKILVAESIVARWGGSLSRDAIHNAGLVYNSSRNFNINRYLSDGKSDRGFCLDTQKKGPNREVLALATQADGKIIIGGWFFNYNGTSKRYCVRVNPDGSIDPTFNAGGDGFNKKVTAIVIQPDGKIIIGGMFTSYNNEPVSGIIRLNEDGTKDLSFNYTLLPLNNEVYGLALQADGKLLVGTLGRAFRLNADGSTDEGFSGLVTATFGVFYPYVSAITVQPDNKILIGGYFSSIQGSSRISNIGRLNEDGTRDNSFNGESTIEYGVFPGTNAPVSSITLQPDGKIIVGGSFDHYYAINSLTGNKNYILRLNNDGLVDNSFNPGGNAANAAVNAVAVLPDGKIMIGGNFTSFNGILINHIARLNGDGTIDGDFNAGGTGANENVSSLIAVNNGNKVLFAGDFNAYNGYGKTRIARLYSNNVPVTTNNVAVCSAQLPYTWLGNSYSTAGTYQNVISYPDGSEVVATLVLTDGPGNILGPDRVCAYVGDSESPFYQIFAPAGSVITWSVSKRTTMQIMSGQGTNHASIRFLSGFTTGTIYVKIVNNACGINITRSLAVTTNMPSTPAAITSNTASICPLIGTANAALYSTKKVSSAIAYNWTSPAGTTVIHPNGPGINDTLIYVIFDNSYAGGSISVQSINDCGASNARSITVNRTLPSAPGAITGPTNVCANLLIGPTADVAHYSVTEVPGVTYNWTVPAGSEVYSAPGISSLDIRFPSTFTSGVISVTAVNGCGTSVARNLTIRALPVAIPGAITETVISSCPDRQYTYSLSSMPANADSVIWTIPAVAILVSGQGTNSITVSYPSTAVQGNITAYAVNHCSSSGVRKFTLNIPACAPTTPFTKGNTIYTGNETVTIADIFEPVVFPNPSVSDFKLLVKTKSNEMINIAIKDVQGRQIRKLTARSYETISFGNWLTPGTYFIEVRQGNQLKTLRIIKQ